MTLINIARILTVIFVNRLTCELKHNFGTLWFLCDLCLPTRMLRAYKKINNARKQLPDGQLLLAITTRSASTATWQVYPNRNISTGYYKLSFNCRVDNSTIYFSGSFKLRISHWMYIKKNELIFSLALIFRNKSFPY